MGYRMGILAIAVVGVGSVPLQAVALDQATPQVMIESRFVQVRDDFQRELGIDWGAGLSGCHDLADMRPRVLGDKPSFAEEVVSSVSGGMLGGLIGDGMGFGIGVGIGSTESNSGGAFLSPNPFDNGPTIAFPFRDKTELQLQFAPSLYQPPVETDDEDDFAVTAPAGPKIPGTMIGVRINEQPVEAFSYSFADAYLVGPDCQRREPDGRLVFVVTQEITFSWSLEYWHWRDDVLQEHWLRTGSSQWEELVGSGSLPLWVGVRFDGLDPATLGEGGWSLVTAWTYEREGKVHLTPRVFDLLPPSTEIKVDDHSLMLNALAASSRDTEIGRVPMLGKIPYIGKLFSAKGDAPQREELMMLITPRIIDSVD